jgi:hypothetical protein
MTIASSPDSTQSSVPARVLHGLNQARFAFRHWRKGRPFNAGFWIIFAGAELWVAPYSSIGIILHEGIAGISAFFIGSLMVMFGLSIWFAPTYRMFAGIASIMLALIALPATNFGGFLIGTLCGVIGGALATAWIPRPGWEAPTRRQRRRIAREQPVEAVLAESAESESMAAGTVLDEWPTSGETMRIPVADETIRISVADDSSVRGPSELTTPADPPGNLASEKRSENGS